MRVLFHSLVMPGVAGALLLALALSPLPAHAGDKAEVRGWAIVNLLRFSYWPDKAYETPDAPTVICARPGEVRLPERYSNAGATVHGRPLILRETPDLRQVRHCQVVFFAETDLTLFNLLYAGRATWPVAYVGDTAGFAASGGSFELILNENNAFFRFNREMLIECDIQLAQALMRMGDLQSHGRGTGDDG